MKYYSYKPAGLRVNTPVRNGYFRQALCVYLMHIPYTCKTATAIIIQPPKEFFSWKRQNTLLSKKLKVKQSREPKRELEYDYYPACFLGAASWRSVEEAG